MICNNCGSDHIIHDMVENEWTYWCGICGKELTLIELEGVEEYEDIEGFEDWIPCLEGNIGEYQAPVFRRDKV